MELGQWVSAVIQTGSAGAVIVVVYMFLRVNEGYRKGCETCRAEFLRVIVEHIKHSESAITVLSSAITALKESIDRNREK